MTTRRLPGLPAQLFAAVVVAAGLGAIGCDPGDDRPSEGEAAAVEATGEATGEDAGTPSSGITVVDPWVRPAIRPAGDGDAPPVHTAAYLVLRNHGAEADALVGVETEVADTAELHSVTMDDRIMRMRPVDSVAVPAGGEAVLEPGGYHIMLVGIRRELVVGDTVGITVRLRSGRVLEVGAGVRSR